MGVPLGLDTKISPRIPVISHRQGFSMPLPDFLIIGSPKAGSTALHVALAQHPDLFLSNPKEPKFFMCDQARPDPAHQKGPGDAHSAQEWVWDRGALRGPVRRRAGRGAPRREHAVLPVGQGISPADSRTDPRREDDRGHQGPDRPGLFQLGPPLVRRAGTGKRLPCGVRLEPARIEAGYAPFWRYLETGLYGQQLEHLYEIFPRNRCSCCGTAS